MTTWAVGTTERLLIHATPGITELEPSMDFATHVDLRGDSSATNRRCARPQRTTCEPLKPNHGCLLAPLDSADKLLVILCCQWCRTKQDLQAVSTQQELAIPRSPALAARTSAMRTPEQCTPRGDQRQYASLMAPISVSAKSKARTMPSVLSWPVWGEPLRKPSATGYPWQISEVSEKRQLPRCRTIRSVPQIKSSEAVDTFKPAPILNVTSLTIYAPNLQITHRAAPASHISTRRDAKSGKRYEAKLVFESRIYPLAKTVEPMSSPALKYHRQSITPNLRSISDRVIENMQYPSFWLDAFWYLPTLASRASKAVNPLDAKKTTSTGAPHRCPDKFIAHRPPICIRQHFRAQSISASPTTPHRSAWLC